MTREVVIQPLQIVVVNDIDIGFSVQGLDTFFSAAEDRRHFEVAEVGPLSHFTRPSVTGNRQGSDYKRRAFTIDILEDLDNHERA